MLVTVRAPYPKISLNNVNFPTANTNILSEDITPVGESSYLNITLCSAINGIVSVVRTINGVTSVEQLNGGLNVDPNVLYLWSVPVRSGDSINIRFSATGGKLVLLRVDEVTV